MRRIGAAFGDLVVDLHEPIAQSRFARSAIAILVATLLFGLTAGTVLAAAPDNDDISTPRVVGAVPYSDGLYDTTEATTGSTDPGFCFAPELGPDRSTVWYSFTPASGGFYLADTINSDFDPTLYVGTPNGAGGIDVIDCNDDTFGLQSAVVWEATAGTEYLLMVGTCCGGGTPGQGGGGGTLEFHVDVSSPPPSVDVTVAARGSFTPAGAATIRGTITCANADGVFIEVSVSQRVGRIVIRGGGFLEVGIECDGTAQPWSVDVSGDNGTFAGGAASVDVFAAACGGLGCDEDFESRTVRLRR